MHLFDITKIVSRSRNQIELHVRATSGTKDKIETIEIDTATKEDSFDEFIALVCSLDEQLFPAKAREDLINIGKKQNSSHQIHTH